MEERILCVILIDCCLFVVCVTCKIQGQGMVLLDVMIRAVIYCHCRISSIVMDL